MWSEQLKAVFDARTKAVTELRALATQADGREFTADEKATEDRLNADIDRLDGRRDDLLKQMEREERQLTAMEKYEAATQKSTGRQLETRNEDQVDTALRKFLSGEVRSLEAKIDVDVLRAINHRAALGYERRDLLLTNVPQPTTFVGRLYEFLVDTSNVRRAGPTVVTTGSGEAMTFPRATAHGNATWLAEGVALTEADPTLGSIVLDAWKLGQLIQLSSEVIQDKGFDLVGYVARAAARNIAIATDTEYVNGTTPTTRPEGIFPNATVGFQQPTGNTTALTTANSGDSLIELVHSVAVPYRTGRASWLMSDALAKIVRKLRDTTGQYLWQPGLQAGQPDTLLGYPVYTDPNVPNPVGASNKVAAFGDFSGYVIRDVANVRFERSDDFAFANDLVSFRAIWRTDGKLIDTSAIKLLQNSAT